MPNRHLRLPAVAERRTEKRSLPLFLPHFCERQSGVKGNRFTTPLRRSCDVEETQAVLPASQAHRTAAVTFFRPTSQPPRCPAAAAGTSMPTSVGRRSGARTRRRAATTTWAFGCSAVPSNRQASERRPGGSGRSHDRRCRSGQVYRHLGGGVNLSNGFWLSTICRRLSISLRRSPGSSKSDRFFMEAGDSSLPHFYHHRLKRPENHRRAVRIRSCLP